MIIGTLDHEMRDFLRKAAPVVIPFFIILFFIIALDTGLNLLQVWQAGLFGVGMGVAVFAGIPLFVVDRLAGGNGVAEVAVASTAGNAAAVRAIVSEANPTYADAAAPATILIAACAVVIAILMPVVTSWIAGLVGRDVEPAEEATTSAAPIVASSASAVGH
jgi:2-keto-3-deoxygluconate permease